MTLVATVLIAFGMSVDAFAASLVKGAALHRPRFLDALRAGAIFGVIEGLTPIVGWAAGLAMADFVQAIDHWIALILLCAVGGKMIYEAVHRDEEEERPQRHSFRLLAVTALGTSIDAMAVGVMVALIEANIWLVAAAIGLATFMMTTLGIMIGRYAGRHLGARAEFVGGLVLIVIGVAIFLEHTMGA